MHTKTLPPSLWCWALTTVLSSMPAHAQNIGSFRDAGNGAVDYCQTIIESEEVRSALGRLVPTVEAARLTLWGSIAIQAARACLTSAASLP